MTRRLPLVLGVAVMSGSALAQDDSAHSHHAHHHGMRVQFVDGGIVSNENATELPLDCGRIAGEHEIVVRAGRKLARRGLAWGYDAAEWRAPGCSKVTVTLRNEDEVRHQWMVHGLPKRLYPMGMFTLTANGGGEVSGSFVVPGEDATYLVHCDVPTHMETGMKAQLVVGAGHGDLPSIPGKTAPRVSDRYEVGWGLKSISVLVVGFFAGLAGTLVLRSSRARRSRAEARERR